MQDRQGEGGGFSGSGLGDADDIASFENERNGLGLDGGRGDVVFFGKSARNRFGEAESIKIGQCVTFPLVANVLSRFQPGTAIAVIKTSRVCQGCRG